jgi:amidase
VATFPYTRYDGYGLATLIKNKEITAEEVIEQAITRIEKLNPSLNAVIHKMYEKARMAVKTHADSPFFGVPMLLKDVIQEIEGEPITYGSKALANNIAARDSEFVRRLRRTGTVFIGQTNVPEFALMGITEPVHYGPTRNPWNPEYTPGGSSGGSAAAVASGMVPIAGANDGGGSIRIPAAFCGLFGIKPSRGRTPVGNSLGRHWQGASVDHVLTRTVRDSALMLNLIKGYEPGAAFHSPPHDADYLACVSQPLTQKLRIAFSVRSPIGTRVDDECRQAVYKTVKWLESMGHIIEEKDAPVDGKKLANSYITLYFGEVAASIHHLEDTLGRKAKWGDVEPATWMLGLLGKVTSAEEWVLSLREWDRTAFIMEDFHKTYDFYVTPTTAFPPSKIGELDLSNKEKRLIKLVDQLGLVRFVKKSGFVDELVEKNLERTPFTQLANLTGQPAMSLPLHLTKSGLPVGVQFIAAKGREDLLFRLAGELEQSEYWIKVDNNPMFAS